jgi:hypothetical protein
MLTEEKNIFKRIKNDEENKNTTRTGTRTRDLLRVKESS